MLSSSCHHELRSTYGMDMQQPGKEYFGFLLNCESLTRYRRRLASVSGCTVCCPVCSHVLHPPGSWIRTFKHARGGYCNEGVLFFLIPRFYLSISTRHTILISASPHWLVHLLFPWSEYIYSEYAYMLELLSTLKICFRPNI